MASAASIFASHARSRVVVFECALDIKVGAYTLREGDGVKAVEDLPTGKWNLYVTWAEGSLGKVPAGTVNTLAGEDVILCSCTDPVHPGDNAYCLVHGRA